MPASSRTRRELGFYLARQEQYDVREIVATVVYKATAADTFDPEEYGRSFNPPSDRLGHPAAAYADFHVRAYVDAHGRCSGLRYVYRPFEMDTARAEASVRTLRRVDRAMESIEQAEGYLPGNDFTAYLLRVARAIGADYFDWRPHPRAAIERTDAEGIDNAITGLFRVVERAA